MSDAWGSAFHILKPYWSMALLSIIVEFAAAEQDVLSAAVANVISDNV